MTETLITAIGLIGAGIIAGVATLLGVDRYRSKKANPDPPTINSSSTIKIDSDQFERLLSAMEGVKMSVKEARADILQEIRNQK